LPSKKEGNAGNGSKYTKARMPVRIVFKVELPDRSTAIRLEMLVKKMPEKRSMRLLAGKYRCPG
jgi:putative endonuclease